MPRRIITLLMLVAVSTLARSQTLKGYEYWLDGDYASRQTVSTTLADISLRLSTAQMAQGVHYLNFHAQATDGEWGPLTRHLFYVPEAMGAAAQVVKMEYWIDSDAASRQAIDVTSDAVEHTIDVSQMAQGVHFLTVRLQNSDGDWCAPSRHIFYVPDAMGVVSVTKMEYWIDNDSENPRTLNVSKGQVSTKIDVSQLSEGIHYLSVRLQSSDGIWSNASRHIFFNPGDDFAVNSPIVGYEYTLNGETQFVAVTEQTEYTMNDVLFPLPDPLLTGSPVGDGCSFAFSATGATLTRNTPVSFSIHFRNKVGNWSNTAGEHLQLTDVVRHDYVNLPMRQSVSLAKATAGDYHALVLSLPKSQKYFLASDAACRLALYKSDGLRIASVSPDQMLQTYGITLGEGTYYAIVYDMGKDGKTTVSLMDNQVPTPSFSYADHTVTISCGKAGADIFYTLDGTTPTIQSTKYDGPFNPDRNCTVKAIATYSGMDNSEIGTYTVGDFKVGTPVITFANLHIYLTTATEGATIRYTLDGSDPLANGQAYNAPAAITGNCTVKAIATRDNWHNSDIATEEIDVTNLTTATPQIERQGDLLIVTSLTEGARFHYTTDGTTPTAQSWQTDRIISPEHNCLVRVIAMKDGELPSPVVDYTVDWMHAEKPSFVFSDGVLTIICNTPGATIYYEIGDATPTRSSNVYSSPLTLTDNRTVRALAVAEHFNDSEVGVYLPDAFTCDTPVLAYDGRHLTMTTATEGATIRYTTDGTLPGNNAAEYTDALTISELQTVKAIAMKANTNSSAVATLQVEYYYDGTQAGTAREGQLSQAFEWCGTDGIESLTLLGSYGDADMQWLKANITTLQHLEMSQARFSGDRLTAETFRGLKVLTLSVPQSATQAADGLFNDCPSLAAIKWSPSFRLTDAMLGTLAANPNLLVYARTRGYAPASLTNVVVDGRADRIVLGDRADGGNANFYCPEAFVADHIAYTHHYAQQTGVSECRGWETLCLPFAVQAVSHPTQGAAAPFAADRHSDERPFWLCRLGASGFEQVAAIEANTPYIISMPNHPTYADEYLLCGNVTFEAQNATVQASNKLVTDQRGTMTLTPALTEKEKGNGMLVLNVGQTFEGYNEGSAFLADLEQDVRPFQAFVVEQNAAVRAIAIDGEATAITETLATITKAGNVTYDLQGRKLSKPIRPGLYIQGGRKVMVK